MTGLRAIFAALLLAVPLVGPLSSPAAAGELGDDGLYKESWQRTTFKDLQEDLAEANAEGKRLMLMIEQRGCIYCTKMHNEVFPLPEVKALLEENYFIVQINMFGDVEVTDFDGEELTEKTLAQRWGTLFTPTIMFFPEEVPDDVTGAQAAVAVMPGAFEADTTIDMLKWVRDKGYEGEESFQKYHARMYQEREG